MGTVIILRGLPGVGKSTYAHQLKADVVVSADQYFVGDDGVYRFVPAEIGLAHQHCFRAFLMALLSGDNRVVVDNTNSKVWELSPYVLAAESHGYQVEIHSLFRPAYQVEALPTTHAVLPATIRAMADGWEDVLPWWNNQQVCIEEQEALGGHRAYPW
jgi:predicted kinase